MCVCTCRDQSGADPVRDELEMVGPISWLDEGICGCLSLGFDNCPSDCRIKHRYRPNRAVKNGL